MRSIKPNLTPNLATQFHNNVAAHPGVIVNQFSDLQRMVAELSCLNKDYVHISEDREKIINRRRNQRRKQHYILLCTERITTNNSGTTWMRPADFYVRNVNHILCLRKSRCCSGVSFNIME